MKDLIIGNYGPEIQGLCTSFIHNRWESRSFVVRSLRAGIERNFAKGTLRLKSPLFLGY